MLSAVALIITGSFILDSQIPALILSLGCSVHHAKPIVIGTHTNINDIHLQIIALTFSKFSTVISDYFFKD